MKDQAANTASDIWALGVLIYYLLFEDYPFDLQVLTKKDDF
jgi:hypothetical protein